MSTLFIAIILVAFALLCFGIDLFIPTGGVLMIIAALAALAGLGFGFAHSAMTGGWLLIFVVLCVFVSLYFFVQIYPHTAIGKQMIINRPQAVPYDFEKGSSGHQLEIGDIGLAKTDLHPAGKIRIDDHDYEAVSVTGIIPAGAAVIVTDIEMNVATVEVYESSVPMQTLNESPAKSSSIEIEPGDSSLLEMPVDQFNLNDFESSKDA
jgi:membrane-bound ClpP family serine protease